MAWCGAGCLRRWPVVNYVSILPSLNYWFIHSFILWLLWRTFSELKLSVSSHLRLLIDHPSHTSLSAASSPFFLWSTNWFHWNREDYVLFLLRDGPGRPHLIMVMSLQPDQFGSSNWLDSGKKIRRKHDWRRRRWEDAFQEDASSNSVAITELRPPPYSLELMK